MTNKTYTYKYIIKRTNAILRIESADSQADHTISRANEEWRLADAKQIDTKSYELSQEKGGILFDKLVTASLKAKQRQRDGWKQVRAAKGAYTY